MNRGGSWRGGYGGRNDSGEREGSESRGDRRYDRGTGRRPTERADEQGDARHGAPSSRWNSGRPDSRPDSRPEGRFDSRSDSRPDGRSDSRPAPRSDGRSDYRSDFRSDSRSDSRSEGRSDYRSDSRSDSRSEGRSDYRSDSRPEYRSDSRPDYRSDSRSDGRSDGRFGSRMDSRGTSGMRFPSDHVGRADDRSAGGLPRFPSDSVRGKHDHVYTAPMESSRPTLGRDGRRDPNAEAPRSAFQTGMRGDARSPRPYGSRGDGHRYSRHARGVLDEMPRPPRAVVDPTFHEVDVAEGDVTQVDPFELFCSYHLGLARDGQVRPPNLLDAARRFNAPPGLLKAALHHYVMDPEGLASVAFDMELARMDIQVSPPGVSKRELARSLYQEFIDALGDRCIWEARPTAGADTARDDFRGEQGRANNAQDFYDDEQDSE